MRKPVVGISSDCLVEPENARTGGRLFLNWNYAAVVAEAGGVPLVIPPTADMAVVEGLLDAWLIPGGLDIDAARFGQSNHPACELQDPRRFDAERRLYDVWPAAKPVLGICYGMQFLNVVRGGTLLQHVPDAVDHERHASGEIERISVRAGTLLAERTGAATIAGKSYHHQAIADLGRGLRVSALAEDGTIEAIEDPSLPFFVGVQWHPERTPGDDATRRLLSAFLRAAV